ncbi:isoprenylcysteine carboxylmethyltransferase family protein [Olivibacter sp. CPCC 100613]|uniref:methyltransferase family protein n=1 Tax=Olivibacter sp. CPCC 100613 TaxID=3079931 RepID=UPI002FFCCD6B
MIRLGIFFFRYRNVLFIFLYFLLFIPSPELFTEKRLGGHYFLYPIALGLLTSISGQIIRGATIGLAYIVRGGQHRKVYADGLVTTGIFKHVRNPLYIGNILMLMGAGILANSLLFILIVMPIFLLIYQSIVLAEEDFLRKKFGQDFVAYTSRIHRWIPNIKGLVNTFSAMEFNWRRWLIKEYGTHLVWLSGITLILLYKYPFLVEKDSDRVLYTTLCALVIGSYYLFVRYMKKSGHWK